MSSCRTAKLLICRSCDRVYDIDPFSAMLPYADSPNDNCRCGGELEYGCECVLCGHISPESETIKDNERSYCTECRSECYYCYEVLTPSEISLSDEGFPICKKCKESEEN